MPYPSGSMRTRAEFEAPFEELSMGPGKLGFVGMKILTPVPTRKPADVYRVKPVEQELKKLGSLRRSPGGEYQRVARKDEEASFKTHELGLETVLDDKMLAAYWDEFDAESDAVGDLWNDVYRAIESEIVDQISSTGVITQTAAASATWDTYATATPIADMLNGIATIFNNTGNRATDAVIQFVDFLNFIQCAEVIDKIKYWGGTDPSAMSLLQNLRIIAANVGLETVHIAGAVHNTADEGLSPSLATIWPAGTVGIYKVAPPARQLKESCVGRTLVWPGDGVQVPQGSDPTLAVESYRDERVRGTVYRARFELDPIVLQAANGFLITGCV